MRKLNVHVLSEYVFCPRAAVLADGSGDDTGEEERDLGPKLGCFADFDESHFAKLLEEEWSNWRVWMFLAAPAFLLFLVVARVSSFSSGVLALLPFCYMAAKVTEATGRLRTVYRERSLSRAATAIEIDPLDNRIRTVNWWSLRRSGFDCLKPVDPHFSIRDELSGRPWRILTKGTALRVPVIRKHRGEPIHRPQHSVRLAAYCRLIEDCEGAQAPFGILMFAVSYDCLLIPISEDAKAAITDQLSEVRQFLETIDSGHSSPPAPTDGRCRCCHWGELRKYVPGKSDTIYDRERLAPYLPEQSMVQGHHSTCGDRFRWIVDHIL